MYAKYEQTPQEPASRAFPITAADTQLARLTRALYVGTAGTLEVTLANDAAAVPKQGPGATAATWVFTAAGNITIASHGLKLGDYVMVTGGTLPTGLAAATGYYVGVVDANTIFLATSLANAKAGVAITLTGSSATCTVYRTWAVDTTAETITIPAHAFITGDRVMVYSTTTLPTGLSAQTQYWVVVVDANTIKLDATSLADALGASPTIVNLGGTPAGILSIFKSTTMATAAVGYHPLCCQQVNAASTATNLVGLT